MVVALLLVKVIVNVQLTHSLGLVFIGSLYIINPVDADYPFISYVSPTPPHLFAFAYNSLDALSQHLSVLSTNIVVDGYRLV